jgi:hypothetical protein
LAIQSMGLAGLMIRPETMQPQARVARDAAAWVGADGLVLLPRGNDGVGVAGVFLLVAPPDLRVQLVDAAPKATSLDAAARFPRIVLALLELDRDSRAASMELARIFAQDPCWRQIANRPAMRAYDRVSPCVRS